MRRKSLWLAVSCLLLLALVVVSCAPAAKPAPAPTPLPAPKPAPKPTPAEKEAVGPVVKEPKYGGWLTTVNELPPVGGWDPVYSLSYWHLGPVTIPLMSGDYYSGPAGLNKVSWRYAVQVEPEYMTKGLAKNWDIPDPKTMIFHIRPGIRWHDKPPVSGREVTADDVKWSFDRLQKTPTSGLGPILRDQAGGRIDYTVLDKYTFKIEFGKPDMRSLFTIRDWYRHTAREVIEKYGNQDDWKNVVGNGPFLLTDYVAGSSMTYKNNPNYWEKDPQGRRLPYIDGFKILIIGDLSTRLAALRAGKIDILREVEWRDAEDILKTNPEIQTTGPFTFLQPTITFHTQHKPFDDLKVRRALMTAIDREAIARDYHKGRASIVVTWMHPPGSVLVPKLEERPASTQEVFKYSPEKAKQLLAEAGYPKGFKTTINIISRDEPMASLVKAYWEKTGVDADIKVHEPAAFTTQQYAYKFDCYLSRSGFSWGNWSWVYQPGAHWNFSQIKDPKLDELIAEATQKYVDWDKWVKDWRAINTHVIDQCYENLLPGPDVHTLWQPWVKNYRGEQYLGRTGYFLFPAYVWIEK